MAKIKKFFKTKVKQLRAEMREQAATRAEERKISREAFNVARKKQLKIEGTRRGKESAMPTKRTSGGASGFFSGAQQLPNMLVGGTQPAQVTPVPKVRPKVTSQKRKKVTKFVKVKGGKYKKQTRYVVVKRRTKKRKQKSKSNTPTTTSSSPAALNFRI